VRAASASLLAALVAAALGLAVGWVLWHSPPEPSDGESSTSTEGDVVRPVAVGDVDSPDRPTPIVSVETPSASLPHERRSGAEAPATLASAPPARRLYDPEVLRERLLAEYRGIAGRAMPEDYLEEALVEGDRRIEATPGDLARRWADRQRLRDDLGEISDPVELLLQARGNASVSLVGLGRAEPAPERSGSPLDMEAAPSPGERAVHFVSGVVPTKKVLLVEEVKIRARLGTGSQRGTFEATFGGQTIAFRDATRALRGTFRGRALVQPFTEDRVRLAVSAGVGEVRLRGRLLDADAPHEGLADFRWIPSDSEGFLLDGPVVVQVSAGSRREVDVNLQGATSMNPKSVTFADREVWNRSLAQEPAVGFVYLDGGGFVPPGKAYRIERISWRAKFAHTNGQFEVRKPGGAGGRIHANGGPANSAHGDWTGELVLRPGQEKNVVVRATRGTVGEATFHGRLVDK
jgi:hypothetical protein